MFYQSVSGMREDLSGAKTVGRGRRGEGRKGEKGRRRRGEGEEEERRRRAGGEQERKSRRGEREGGGDEGEE